MGKKEKLKEEIMEASSALNRAYYTDLTKDQLIIRVKRIAANLVFATEEA